MDKNFFSKSKWQEWLQKERSHSTCVVTWDEPLSRYTYYGVGGPAAVFSEPKSLEELEWLARGIKETQVPVFILGMGSNLLVSDEGFDGLVVRTIKLNKEIFLQPEVLAPQQSSVLRTGGSVAVSSLLRRASREGWAGLEWMAGIPGSIGGVVSMNGGTHLGEAKDHLWRVEAFLLHDSNLKLQGPDLKSSSRLKIFDRKDFQFEYRKNLFLPQGAVVYAVEWQISLDDPIQVKLSIDHVLERRKATQPLDFPSCGSVFKNSKQGGFQAWQIVEKLRLRGHRIGGAQFSEKHCNFILNLGNAKAADIYQLIQLAKSRARAELGVELEEEVKLLGTMV